MAIVEQCCCGCFLKPGCIIIGFYYLGINLLQIGIIGEQLDRLHPETDNQDRKTLLTMELLFVVINAICGLLLVFEAIREKAIMLLGWVFVVTPVVIAITIIEVIFSVSLMWTMLIVTLFLLPHAYCVLIVFSYYQTLLENPK